MLRNRDEITQLTNFHKFPRILSVYTHYYSIIATARTDPAVPPLTLIGNAQNLNPCLTGTLIKIG